MAPALGTRADVERRDGDKDASDKRWPTTISGVQPESDSADAEPYPRLTPGARVMAGAELEETHPVASQVERDSRQPFVLQQVRVKLRAELHEMVRIGLSANLDSEPAVRSAYIHFKFDRLLEARIGRFKRPMSRVELTSVGRLPFSGRGVFNDLLIEDVGWGDRALGLMVRGKLKRPKLRYWVAVMNSAPSVDVSWAEELRGADFLGRVQYKPFKALTIAVNGGHKLTETHINGDRVALNAFGGDIELDVGDGELVLESIAAQNTRPPAPPVTDGRTPWAMNVIGYFKYEFDLWGDFELQPVVLAEWVDTDLDVSQDETLRVVFGCNLLWGKGERVRLMPQVSLLRPLGTVGDRSQTEAEVYTLMVSVEL